MKTYPCTSCGQCCRTAAKLGLPPKEEGSSVCAHLDEETNLCKIYEKRPLVCRVDDLYDTLAVKMIEMNKPRKSREEYYQDNADACNEVIREAGLGDEFLVQIGAAA